MFQIKRPETAFSVIRQKRPRQKRDDHLAFIRSLPSCISLTRRNIEAAHIRAPSPRYGKRHTGMGEKPDDRWVLPLTHDEHMEQHQAGDELAWWKSKGIDPFALCLALYGASGDEEAAMQIIVTNAPRGVKPEWRVAP